MCVLLNTERSSLLLSDTTVRKLFSLSAQLSPEVRLGIKIALLHGELKGTLFMQKPDKFDAPDRSTKVKKLT